MNAFITGSRKYGKPTAQSDIDIVIRCSREDEQKLAELCDPPCPPMRFGKLNIVACCSDEEFAAWLIGTAKTLRDETAGTNKSRQVAIDNIDSLLQDVGLRGGPRVSGLAGNQEDPQLLLAP